LHESRVTGRIQLFQRLITQKYRSLPRVDGNRLPDPCRDRARLKQDLFDTEPEERCPKATSQRATPPFHPGLTGCQTKRAHLLEISGQERPSNPANSISLPLPRQPNCDRRPVRQFRHTYPGFGRDVTGKNDAGRILSEMAHRIVAFAAMTHSDGRDDATALNIARIAFPQNFWISIHSAVHF
jgi:hypothetical protein